MNQGNVKHETIHMHVRRKVTQCSTMQCNAKSQSNPRTPGNSEISGTGNPTKDLGEPRQRVASAIGSLSQTNGGRREERVGKREEGEARIQAERRMRKDSCRGGWREDKRRKGKEAGGIA